MILIISSHGDSDVARVAERLRRVGHDHRVFDPADYPARSSLSVTFGRQRMSARLNLGESGSVDLADVKVAWYRHPGKVRASESVGDTPTRGIIEDESRLALQGVWSALNCFWVPAAPDRIPAAEYKVRELLVAQSVGFALPETLVSNDPHAFLRFCRAHRGDVISKPLGTSVVTEMPGLIRYTERISNRDLLHFRSVALAPTIFQAQITKRVEIRATVVGNEVYAVEIHSQQTARTRQDWRRYNVSHTPHLRHELPPAVAKRCVKVVAAMGLCFGAVDLILTPDDQYVFLEVNAGGQWEWMEEMTGLPIDDAVCRLLCQLDQPRTQTEHRGPKHTKEAA